MGESVPKQYLSINDVPMLFRTVDVFLRVPRITRVCVILAANDTTWDKLWPAFVETSGMNTSRAVDRVEVLRCGGATRAESVHNALVRVNALEHRMDKGDWAIVHDAARPCIRSALIEQFLDELVDDPVGGLLALPVADTLKAASEDQRVERTVSRESLWRAQTPQMFRYDALKSALAKSPSATDESSAMEALGSRPRLVIGDSTNLKVTYASDLKLAEMLLAIDDAAIGARARQ
jgi:2-C-methyl-D-erythritol 4-phosphate cytidylyltransferase